MRKVPPPHSVKSSVFRTYCRASCAVARQWHVTWHNDELCGSLAVPPRRFGGDSNLEARHSQLRGETAHDVLDARVLVEAVGAQILAVAALLEAAWCGLGFGVGLRFGVGLGVGLGVGFGVGLGVGLGLGFGVGLGLGYV